MHAVQWLLATAAAVVVGAAVAGPALGEYPHSTSVGPVQRVALTIAPGSTTATAERVVGKNFAVEPGVPVRLSITNVTHRAHTFTIPALGLSVLVGPATASAPARQVVTFTTHGYGVLAWVCLMCPDAHHEVATTEMGGKVYSIIAV